MKTLLSPKAILGVLVCVLLLTGWGCKKAPVSANITPQILEPSIPSDASRSENYTLVPLKQDLQVAPATTTEATTTTSSTTQ